MSVEDFNKVGGEESQDKDLKDVDLQNKDNASQDPQQKKFSDVDSIFEEGLNSIEVAEAEVAETEVLSDTVAEGAVSSEEPELNSETPTEEIQDAVATVDSEAVVEQVEEGAQPEEGQVEESGQPEEPAPPRDPKYDNPDLKWYVVNAFSSYEAKAKKALEDRINNSNIADMFGEVRVPEETVVELVRGQKKTASRKFFPGYMLVQMVMNEHTWHLVTNTPKISGFIGDKTNPLPLAQDEVNKILQQVEEGAASPVARLKFAEGETVKVIDGPFSDFNGVVEDISPEKGKLKVLISIFGRATPVELDFVQVEKVTA